MQPPVIDHREPVHFGPWRLFYAGVQIDPTRLLNDGSVMGKFAEEFAALEFDLGPAMNNEHDLIDEDANKYEVRQVRKAVSLAPSWGKGSGRSYEAKDVVRKILSVDFWIFVLIEPTERTVEMWKIDREDLFGLYTRGEIPKRGLMARSSFLNLMKRIQ